MTKLAWSIFLVVLPIVLIIGFFAIPANGEPLFPSFGVLLGRLGALPDFTQEVRESVFNMERAVAAFQVSIGGVYDLPSFFSSVGSFFTVVGQFFMVVGNVIAIPVRFVIFVFQLIGVAYA